MANIINSFCSFYHLFNCKIFKKKKKMKFRTIILVLSSVIIFSCSDEQINQKLTEKELIEHLINRNNNYEFIVPTDLYVMRRDIPEPIYFDSLEEMDEFLDAINSVSGPSPNTPNVIMQYYEQ